MDIELELKIREGVKKALDNAARIWEKVGSKMLLEKSFDTFSADTAVPSQIPGHHSVRQSKPEVANFIAFVLDIRKSTDHLLQARSVEPTQLERVLYETSAINTAGAIVIEHFNGGLTEYLGDGFLALFEVKDEKNSENDVYKAYDAANYCLGESLNIVNEIICEKYELPRLDIGIGLAYSRAIVTIVGLEDNLHPKVIGECVYRASKLSSGINEICIDERLKNLWPTTKNGKLRFTQKNMMKFNGYLLSRIS